MFLERKFFSTYTQI